MPEKTCPAGDGLVTQEGYICKDCGYLIPNKFGVNKLPDNSPIWHRPIPASEGQYMASVERLGVSGLVSCDEVAGQDATIRSLRAMQKAMLLDYQFQKTRAEKAEDEITRLQGIDLLKALDDARPVMFNVGMSLCAFCSGKITPDPERQPCSHEIARVWMKKHFPELNS